MKKILLLISVILINQLLFSQEKTPVIKATSLMVKVRESGSPDRTIWKINPELKLNVYTTEYSLNGKTISFYTDMDSISLDIDPKKETCEFIIVLKRKDSVSIQINSKIPYLIKLRNAEEYNYSDNRAIPSFTYMAKEDSDLVRVRQSLNLDSIAGQGNEISKILNLLHWVHYVVWHDGEAMNPSSKNAIDLISYCKNKSRGMSCRMMATILNECYLSMGFKSRFVACMPKEINFDECHVINAVYSNDLKKWIWIDPTFDAYIMNEKGELLGIQEVRERLIKGEPLILNPEANWNRIESETKEKYLEQYMAKNLYRVQCPLVSEYDAETWSKRKEITYIELLPLDGLEQNPQKVEERNNSGLKYTNIKTNNPDLFWAKPE
jgi:hypothetical protein